MCVCVCMCVCTLKELFNIVLPNTSVQNAWTDALFILMAVVQFAALAVFALRLLTELSIRLRMPPPTPHPQALFFALRFINSLLR